MPHPLDLLASNAQLLSYVDAVDEHLGGVGGERPVPTRTSRHGQSGRGDDGGEPARATPLRKIPVVRAHTAAYPAAER
ncbi:hypothetical protein [Mycolicibacterium doricum]|uniref:hypothetical protein n=1 Tax=Mycolicibacterium doricum TaxID=126673 RepID=UPI001F3614EB|nr:hypothetical protein [Mycolicibacterium doricum]